MAFTASALLEVQTGGDDTNNGGIFDTGVAGFPTDGAATSATGNSPVFTSASYNFQASDVGAWIYIKSGTNWTPGWYQIASVSANAATLTASVGLAVLSNGSLSTVAGCATTASPTAATWGIDYSQQAGSQITFTDMVIDGTTNTKFTSSGHPVGKNFVGNSISVTSGTGFTVQRVAVVSTSGTTATCDKSLGTLSSTGGAGRFGGALASIGQAGGLLVGSNRVYAKTGSYSITSASTNIAAGCISIGVTTVVIEGYGTIRGDLASPPTLLASGISTASIIASTANDSQVRNLIVDGASLAAIRGVILSRGTGYLLTAKNCTNSGFIQTAGYAQWIKCVATGCSTQPAFQGGGIYIDCEAYGNTVSGFNVNAAASTVLDCLSYGNSGASSDGFAGSAAQVYFANCTAYGNGRDGFRFSAGSAVAINNIAEGNTGVGFTFSSTGQVSLYNGGYNNTGGNQSTASSTNLQTIGFITGTASFFVAAGSNNFATNNTAGGGTLARAAGLPGVFPRGTTTGYQDIGAAQHQDIPPFGFLGSGSFAIQ